MVAGLGNNEEPARSAAGTVDPNATLSGELPRPEPAPERYRPVRAVASGGQAEVWEAIDTLDGRVVALKRFHRVATRDLQRFAREVAALRQLDVPGVVTLLDHGVDGDGRPWTVTAWVEGRPFPGLEAPAPWAELQPRVVALLDALARVHDAGLLHRDIKPDNVLVDARGEPTILDFGLARGEAPGATVTQIGAPLGTPRYMAPEQARGARSDRRADLYAVGVMLYEALTGTSPHPADDWRALVEARATRRAPSLRTLAPAVPARVAEVVDRLLAVDPAGRPGSARQALRALGGGGLADDRVPWLGSPEPVRRAVEALLDGRAAGVAGPRGSGRTRFVDEVEAALHAHGVEPVRLPAGTRPYESLVAVTGAPDVQRSDEVDAAVARGLGALLARAPLLVDDLEAVDPWSRRVLLGAAGPVLVARRTPEPGDHRLGPWTPAEVAPLFAGPERLFHLRSDAAALLVRRSGGMPAAAVAELERWVTARLARWEGGRLRVDRLALERIAEGQAGYPGAYADEPGGAPELDELLAWVHLAGDAAAIDLLARARGERRWQVELQVAALVEAGAVVRQGDRLEARRASGALAGWDLDAQARVRARLAAELEPGAPGRLGHLVVAGEDGAAAAEAATVGAAAWREGRVDRAVAAILEGLRVAPEGAVAPLARTLVGVTVEEGSPRLLQRAAEALGRAAGVPEPAGRILAAALDVHQGDPARAALRLGPAAPVDPELAWAWWAVRVGAARLCGREAWAEAVEAAGRWAEADEGAATRALGWRATWLYTEGRLREAAEAAEAEARGAVHAGQRLEAWFRAASAWIELAEVDRTRAAAAALIAEARARRLVRAEARAEWVLRSLANRLGATAVDEELVEAAEALDAPGIRGTLLVVEAACAWRGGALDRAAALAGSAEAAFAEAGNRPAELYARALRHAADPPDPERVEALARELVALGRPDVSAEGLVLLTGAGLDAAPWRPTIAAALAAAPPVPAGWRRGVLAYPLQEYPWTDPSVR